MESSLSRNTMHIQNPARFLSFVAVALLFIAFALIMFWLEIRAKKARQLAKEKIPDLVKYGWINDRELRKRLREQGIRIGRTHFYFVLSELIEEGLINDRVRPAPVLAGDSWRYEYRLARS